MLGMRSGDEKLSSAVCGMFSSRGVSERLSVDSGLVQGVRPFLANFVPRCLRVYIFHSLQI